MGSNALSQRTESKVPSASRSRLRLRECKTLKKRRSLLVATGSITSDVLARPDVDPSIQALAGNVIDTYEVPIGVADNFLINERETPIYMATQERTVVEAASHGAYLCRATGGFRVQVGENLVSCQVAFMPLDSDEKTDAALSKLAASKKKLLNELRQHDTLRKYGAGIVGLGLEPPRHHALKWETLGRDRMIVLTLTIDAGESMGANAVTKLGEELAGLVERLIGSRSVMSIVTNCFQGLSITASAMWPTLAVGGKAAVERILQAQRFAELSDERAVTHNKGISNGVDAVALLCGQDVQAIEASMHASASARGRSSKNPIAPLTTYRTVAGALRGELRMRIPLGTVGGATAHPSAKRYREAMGITDVRELARVLGAVGLAQNFGALRCLVNEGITAAHERLEP